MKVQIYLYNMYPSPLFIGRLLFTSPAYSLGILFFFSKRRMIRVRVRINDGRADVLPYFLTDCFEYLEEIQNIIASLQVFRLHETSRIKAM